MSLMGFINNAGYALDTPGAYIRGLAANKPGQRVSGRELVSPLFGENKEGLDAGDVPGFLAEVLLDPLTWLGGLGIAKATKYLKHLRQVRKAKEAMEWAPAAQKAVAGSGIKGGWKPVAGQAAPVVTTEPLSVATKQMATPSLDDVLRSRPAPAPPTTVSPATAAAPAPVAAPASTVTPAAAAKKAVTKAAKRAKWQEMAIQDAAKRGSADAITLPDLYQAIKAQHPRLTEKQFLDGMKKLYEAGEIRLTEYTRAPADIVGKMQIPNPFKYGDPYYFVERPIQGQRIGRIF